MSDDKKDPRAGVIAQGHGILAALRGEVKLTPEETAEATRDIAATQEDPELWMMLSSTRGLVATHPELPAGSVHRAQLVALEAEFERRGPMKVWQAAYTYLAAQLDAADLAHHIAQGKKRLETLAADDNEPMQTLVRCYEAELQKRGGQAT